MNEDILHDPRPIVALEWYLESEEFRAYTRPSPGWQKPNCDKIEPYCALDDTIWFRCIRNGQVTTRRALSKCSAVIYAIAAPTPEPAQVPAKVNPFEPFEGPFAYDKLGGCIFDRERHLFLDLRGFGYLIGNGAGGCGYTHRQTEDAQARLGAAVVAQLNKVL